MWGVETYIDEDDFGDDVCQDRAGAAVVAYGRRTKKRRMACILACSNEVIEGGGGWVKKNAGLSLVPSDK